MTENTSADTHQVLVIAAIVVETKRARGDIDGRGAMAKRVQQLVF